jgi:hypothetical protein
VRLRPQRFTGVTERLVVGPKTKTRRHRKIDRRPPAVSLAWSGAIPVESQTNKLNAAKLFAILKLANCNSRAWNGLVALLTMEGNGHKSRAEMKREEMGTASKI